MEKLDKIIEGLVVEKSLSLEVFQRLQEIKSESENVLERNINLEEEINVLKNNNDLYLKTIEDLKFELSKWIQKESDLVDREKKVLDLEHLIQLKDKDVEIANNVSNAIKDVVGLVFKNTIIRKGINKSVSVPVSVNGYVQNSYTNEIYNEDIKEIDE